MKPKSFISFLIISLLACSSLYSQVPPYQLGLFSVSGGGEASGGNYSLQFKMAQPVQGEGSSPQYSVSSGFMTPAILISSATTVSRQFNVRWNLISLPLFVDDPRKSILFPEAVSEAYSFLEGGGYQTEDTLKHGVGYWLKVSPPMNASINGLPRSSDTLTIVEGWNLVGSLSNTINVEGIFTIPSGILSTYFYKYTTGYAPADSLEPMLGYWVKSQQDGLLVLGESGGFTSGTITHQLSQADEKPFNEIKIRDKVGNQQLLRFGMDDVQGKVSLNSGLFELPPVPPAGIFDARFSDNRSTVLFKENVQKQSIGISVRSSQFPLEISWNVFEEENLKYYLSTEVNTNESDLTLLTGNRNIVIDNPKKAQLTLMLYNGKTDALLPGEYALHQNYPNPFNPVSTIKFDLPKDSRVTIIVFDLLGREAAILADNQEYDAGVQRIEFNAARLASGMYFYRLTAQSEGKTFTDVKKMLLLK